MFRFGLNDFVQVVLKIKLKMDPMNVEVPEIQNLFNLDPYLKPHEKEIRRRYEMI